MAPVSLIPVALAPVTGFAWTDHQFVGGALCLDLTNTVIYPADPEAARDRIGTSDDLANWLGHAGRHHAVLPDRDRGTTPALELDLAAVHRLRGAIDQVLRPGSETSSETGGEKGAERGGDAVSALMHAAGDAFQDSPWEIRQTGLFISSSSDPLVAIARSAMHLVFSPEAAAVKACAACDWLFVDRSRGKRRKWCDMRSCGNRAKAARHYRRRKAPA